jgi:hypothetical protein
MHVTGGTDEVLISCPGFLASGTQLVFQSFWDFENSKCDLVEFAEFLCGRLFLEHVTHPFIESCEGNYSSAFKHANGISNNYSFTNPCKTCRTRRAAGLLTQPFCCRNP